MGGGGAARALCPLPVSYAYVSLRGFNCPVDAVYTDVGIWGTDVNKATSYKAKAKVNHSTAKTEALGFMGNAKVKALNFRAKNVGLMAKAET